jgi:hypothetical protein
MDEPQRPAQSKLAGLDRPLWTQYWAELERRRGPGFARSEARTPARAERAGLLRPAERTTSWPWAAIRGDQNPDGLHPVLGRAE